MEPAIIITGLGHGHPEHKLSNAFFESLDIDSSASWVAERTGIQARYSVLSPDCLLRLRHGELSYQQVRAAGAIPSLASMAQLPWQMALGRSDRPLDYQPELLISGTSVPDFDIPASASLIGQALGLKSTAFDANSACSSFVTDLAIAAALLRQGAFHSAAIFNIERYSIRLDYRDRRNCVLFGDGAACALLTCQQDGQGPQRGLRLLDTVLHSDPSGADLVSIPVDGYFSQSGARVQKFAITKTCQVTNEIVSRNQLHISDLSYFIGHQANLRMLQAAVQKLGLSASQHLFNVDLYGNQGAAGAPVVLSQNWERFRPGELLVVAVVGSGLTWGAALFEVL